jgi:hypothetical protein
VGSSSKIQFPGFPADFAGKEENIFPWNSRGNGNGKSRKETLAIAYVAKSRPDVDG